MTDNKCHTCGNPECHCECGYPSPRTPWNRDIPLHHMPGSFELRESFRAFQDKMLGHIRREFRYRSFAAHLLKQVEGVSNFLTPETKAIFDKAVEAWKGELDDISKL